MSQKWEKDITCVIFKSATLVLYYDLTNENIFNIQTSDDGQWTVNTDNYFNMIGTRYDSSTNY